VLCAALIGLAAVPDGQPVVERARLVAWVERANAIFAPYDLPASVAR
jgi:hypothetical protein